MEQVGAIVLAVMGLVVKRQLSATMFIAQGSALPPITQPHGDIGMEADGHHSSFPE